MKMTIEEGYLQQKFTLVKRLHCSTRKIFNLVEVKQFDNLPYLFEEREEIITEINYIDQIYQKKCNLSNCSIPLVKDYISKLRKLFLEVQKMDTDLTKMLTVLKEDGVKDLHQIKKARKVQAAYKSYTQQGFLFDKQR